MAKLTAYPYIAIIYCFYDDSVFCERFQTESQMISRLRYLSYPFMYLTMKICVYDKSIQKLRCSFPPSIFKDWRCRKVSKTSKDIVEQDLF